jgi:histidyl-tRNA synthetase
MKLDITEIHFLKSALEAINIKAADAPTVARTIEKLDKEFVRLQKLEEKKQPSNGVMEAAK